MMFCSTFTDVNSSLSTVGAVTPVPMRPTYQTLGLAVREHMRLEGTNVMCAHISLRMVAFSFSTALCFQIYMRPEPRGSTSSCCTLHLTFPTMSHNVLKADEFLSFLHNCINCFSVQFRQLFCKKVIW